MSRVAGSTFPHLNKEGLVKKYGNSATKADNYY